MCEKESALKLIVSFKDEDDMQKMLEKVEFIRVLAGLPNNATAIHQALIYVHQLYKLQLDGWEISLCKRGYNSQGLKLHIKN